MNISMTVSIPPWKGWWQKGPYASSQTMPIQTHHFIRNQLLGTSLANSATLSTLPLRKPFTLSPKRDRGKKIPSVPAQSWKLHNCRSTQPAYQIVLVYEALREHSFSFYCCSLACKWLYFISSGIQCKDFWANLWFNDAGGCLEPQMHPGKAECCPILWSVADEHWGLQCTGAQHHSSDLCTSTFIPLGQLRGAGLALSSCVFQTKICCIMYVERSLVLKPSLFVKCCVTERP